MKGSKDPELKPINPGVEENVTPKSEIIPEKERGHWEHPFDFFVSCLGYAVGLGNIWRFPFLCYQHGGGSFLIPYFVLLLLAGLPVFFLEVVLGQYAGVGPVKTFALLAPCMRGLGYGYPRWQSVGTLFLAWSIVAVSLIKGVKSSGKVIYFTSFFPYAILLILAVRGFTLPGAWIGLKYFLTPRWDALFHFEIWVDAATQVIFSLGPACGCVITLSSYNHFKRNCQRDVVLVALSNSLTSVFSGMVVFSILGFMAYDTKRDISQVVQGGPGLAFMVYPEVVTKMTGSNLFSALFFAMLISLALGSIFGGFETIISGLCDEFPALRHRKSTLVIAISALMFMGGLLFTCGGGIHMFNIFNTCAPSWNLLVFTLLEVVLIGTLYGTDRILADINEMGMNLNHFQRLYWSMCWKYFTPMVLFGLLLVAWMSVGRIQLDGHVYPGWVQIMGHLITGSTLIWVPIFVFLVVGKTWNTDAFKTILQPTPAWQ
eukprot:maker-scaffold1533_size36968-snap-gene-0.12 protein:Tk06283 transcript:maker-scaffold1533_size36968-snap-gene-0.12-mRNA-1 annotation:"sodium- and chloride-dependent glycine transporter 2"